MAHSITCGVIFANNGSAVIIANNGSSESFRYRLDYGRYSLSRWCIRPFLKGLYPNCERRKSWHFMDKY